MSSGRDDVVFPSDVLVIRGVGFQAAIEDANESVGYLSQRGLVTDSPAA